MSTRIDQLATLANLRERGLISAEEFEREKARLLASADPAPDMAPPREEVGLMPDPGMVWAILATIFCFLPFGIVAIVKASQVATLWHTGRYTEARLAADSARGWSIAAAVLGVIITIIYVAVASRR